MKSTARILIVEDDPDDCLVFQHSILAIRPGYTVTFKDDAVQALRYLSIADQLPSLIVSDINMPKMDGLEFRKAILAHERSELHTVPFVFLTTAGTAFVKSQLGKINVDGIYEKPLTRAKVQEVFQDMLSKCAL
jgi:CheY-like chemotaxis protein